MGEIASVRRTHSRLEIATLGPSLSDSAVVAHSITSRVKLCSSFPLAISWALEKNSRALVPCGFLGAEKESVGWVDLHFASISKLQCYEVFLNPLQPLALARRKGSSGSTVAIHPATRSLLKAEEFSKFFSSEPEVLEVVSKPLGVNQTAAGLTDYCIGSAPDIRRYKNLEILNTINANMVWALYKTKDSAGIP